MKIGIIGGGASGSYLAIRLKELNPDFSVSIIEKNDKLLKKVAVTGNGRCNYANMGDLTGKYNNNFANKLLYNFSPKDIVETFERFGIHPTYLDDLVFPVSMSAQTVVMMFEKRLRQLDVNIHLGEQVLDYKASKVGYLLKTNKDVFLFDALVFSAGGKAYPQLGTNGAILDMLSKHGYNIKELSPSLSPIKVKENVKKISGQRVKCSVSLFNDNKLAYQEDGEVLFKDEGISGIVILNMSQKINSLPNRNNVYLSLDLAKGYGDINEEDYEQYVTPKIAAYLKEHHLDIHALKYTFKSFYDYNIAEVSHGGLSLDSITPNLESKSEKNVYFTGELLDIDGMCGGFNLMFAFASAEKVANSIQDF